MFQPIVNLSQGQAQGTIKITLNDVRYYSFQGIPYAQPPIGPLRFKAPVPLEKWDGILDATKEGSSCYNQDVFLGNAMQGSENCLFLNVYTKTMDKAILKPVLFWIHGGGFFFGSSSTKVYGPDFLLAEDVVLVTINYRLGLFGFLALEDPTLNIPGNAGFKDMIVALKWVQENIREFGGNPDNVTIFGESCGSISVNLLMVSPLGKGLFHRAISQSGVAISDYPHGDYICKRGSAIAGLPTDEKTFLEEISTKSTEEVFAIQEKIFSVEQILVVNSVIKNIRGKGIQYILGYVIERNHPDSFLVEQPMVSMLNGNYNQVPYILGYNTEEGIIMTELQLVENRPSIPWTFGYETDTDAVSEEMRRFYETKRDGIEPKDLITDKEFLFGIFFTAAILTITSKAPVFLYRFSLSTTLNLFKGFLNQIGSPGAYHSDDLGYIFKNYKTPEILVGSVEEISIKRIVRLWSNFARFGDPTPKTDDVLQLKWKPNEKKCINILNIDEDLKVLRGSYPEDERISFWFELFRKSPVGKELADRFDIVKEILNV